LRPKHFFSLSKQLPVRRVFLFILLSLSLSGTLQARQKPEWESSKLQELFKQGVLAAQKQEWLNALGYFEEVRRSVPLAPELLFNVGLTEEAMPGRELRALGWFKAYLAIVPEGPNNKSIEDTCRTLEKEVRKRVTAWLRESGRIAGHLPEDETRNRNLVKVAVAQAETGNVVDAEETVYQIDAGRYRDEACQHLARLLAEAGNVTGAKKILGLCNPITCDKHEILMAIAAAQAKEGHVQGALSTLKEDREWISRYGKNKSVQYQESGALQKRVTGGGDAVKTGTPETEPPPSKPTPEDQKKKAEAIIRFIETRLDKPYFLNPEAYWGYLETQTIPRARFEAVLEAALNMDGALKDLQKLDRKL
jgi:hypothetical protein